jgi:DNA-binding NtrC family response regulator
VRELQHAIERAVLLARGPTIAANEIDIPGTSDNAAGDESFRIAKERVVQQFERAYIERLLKACEGNVTHAALEAKKNRRAFFALMRKHGIERQRFRIAK